MESGREERERDARGGVKVRFAGKRVLIRKKEGYFFPDRFQRGKVHAPGEISELAEMKVYMYTDAKTRDRWNENSLAVKIRRYVNGRSFIVAVVRGLRYKRRILY